MNKKQTEEYNKYVKDLGITTKGEDFVLKHILKRDWGRDILLQSIKEIKLRNGLISVRCSTRRHTYWFSVSDIESTGWKSGMTGADKEVYVSGDLYHKLYE